MGFDKRFCIYLKPHNDRFMYFLPVYTTGGDTNVLISKNKTKTPTIRPKRLIKSMSVILTAFADLTLKMTDILQTSKRKEMVKIEKIERRQACNVQASI